MFSIYLHDEYHAPLEREWFGESVCLIASLELHFSCSNLYSVSKSLKTLKSFFSIKSFWSTKHLSHVITHLFFHEIA